MINPYNYRQLNDGINCSLTEENAFCSRYSVDFPSAQTARYLGDNRIKGEFLFPKGNNRAPLAILVHGMGDRSVIPCRMIARTLAKKGIASFILYLIFHKCRATEVIKNKYPGLSAEEWFESYQISVTDVRQVLDWAATRQEVMQDKIFIAGISFGSFASSIAMALDSRLKAGIFIVSGGNSDKLTKHSLLLRWQYKLDKLEYQRSQDSYTKYLEAVAIKGFENVEATKNSYLTDPMTFSTYLKDRPIMMLNALWDEMIPKAATLDLWRSYGKPPIHWYPATHASIWLWYPLMGARISGFLDSVLQKTG